MVQEEIKKIPGKSKGDCEKSSEILVRNLLQVFPNWHAKLVKPFKSSLNREMSLETYYCLETVKAKGKITMTELAQELRVPKQQVTKLIDKLSQHNFIERVPDERDRRAIGIRLTPEAVAYLEQYHLKNRGFIESLEEQLTEEEIQRLNTAAEILCEILPKLQ